MSEIDSEKAQVGTLRKFLIFYRLRKIYRRRQKDSELMNRRSGAIRVSQVYRTRTKRRHNDFKINHRKIIRTERLES